MTSIADFSARSIDGQDVALSGFEGEVVLVVNTASQCGFTPQYEGLQSLHDQFKDHGFTVLGFPCDQFGGQEPGSDEEIAGFCQKNFGVDFPLFSKIEVNGDEAHPLYQWLRSQKGGLLGDKIKWNFTKFLVGKRRAGHRPLRPHDQAGEADRRHREGARLLTAVGLIQPEVVLEPDGEAGVLRDPAHPGEHARHERLPVEGVVPDRQHLPHPAQQHLLVRDEPAQPHRVDGDAVDASAPRAESSLVVASGTSPRPASARAAATSRAVRAAVPDGASTFCGWCSSTISTDS